MDVVQIIKDAINKHALANALVDVYFGESDEITVYTADESITNLDEEIYALLWNSLQASIPSSIYEKIVAVYIETLEERSRRRNQGKDDAFMMSKIWYYPLPNGSRYWLFIDVRQDSNGYESVYYIMEIDKNQLLDQDAMRYVYGNEVVGLMKKTRPDDEFSIYLFRDVYSIGRNIIQSKLMEKYERIKKNENLYGNDNPYKDAFSQIILKPVERLESIVTQEECELFKQTVIPKLSEFDVNTSIVRGVNVFQEFNKYKTSVKID